MAIQLTLHVTPRAQTGRSASRRTRKAGQIPAILYGKHVKPETLAIDNAEFVRLRKAVSTAPCSSSSSVPTAPTARFPSSRRSSATPSPTATSMWTSTRSRPTRNLRSTCPCRPSASRLA